jgi:hypothetical protein
MADGHALDDHVPSQEGARVGMEHEVPESIRRRRPIGRVRRATLDGLDREGAAPVAQLGDQLALGRAG